MNIDISWYDQRVSPSVNRIALSLEDLEKDVSSCTKCMLHETRHQTVFGEGPICSEIMIVGEAPGKEEDEQGIPFVGRAGKLLDKILLAIGLNRSRDVFIVNILKCKPPKNRDPLPSEIEKYIPYLQKQIKLYLLRCWRRGGSSKFNKSELHLMHNRSSCSL